MKLTVELVPSTAWCHNLRSVLSTEDWDDLRGACYRKAAYQCEVCGGRGEKHPVECHEIWEYDDTNHIQKLMGLIALCPPCHEVKHFGRSLSVGKGSVAWKQLMKVNRMGIKECELYLEGVFNQYDERCRHEWTLDLSWLKGKVNGYKD